MRTVKEIESRELGRYVFLSKGEYKIVTKVLSEISGDSFSKYQVDSIVEYYDNNDLQGDPIKVVKKSYPFGKYQYAKHYYLSNRY